MNRSIQKILITGCSYSTSDCQSGWKEINLHKTYPRILESKTNWQITNRAVGGCSNLEIFQRTIENCLEEKYDLCIVQWSSLHRLWLYEADDNVDDFTIILPNVCGKIKDPDVPLTVEKVMVSHYLNDYMALKHWLHYQVALQSFFQQYCIPYIFIRGYENYVPELENLVRQWPKDSIPDIDIPVTIKNLLNFDHNPDDYLYQKLSRLITAYLQVDKSNCIGYNCNPKDYGILDAEFVMDYADDNQHPGYQVNTILVDAILNHIRNGHTI